MTQENRNELRGILGGMAIVFGANLAAMLLLITIPLIGLVQLLYVIPLIISFKNQQSWGLMKGVIIAAVITILLNGGCWLWLGLQ